jgi:hypothetical protein
MTNVSRLYLFFGLVMFCCWVVRFKTAAVSSEYTESKWKSGWSVTNFERSKQKIKWPNTTPRDLYWPPNIILVFISGRMWWTEHTARRGGRRVAHIILVGKPNGKSSLGRFRRKWRITRDWLKKMMWEGPIWLRVEAGDGLLCMRQWTFGVP